MQKNELTIVLLDDHPLILKGLSDLISATFDFKIFTANKSIELFKYFNSNKVDILIVDIELKDDINGMEVIETIKKQNKTVKIISYTNISNLWVLKKLIKLEIDGIVLKNCDNHELVCAIANVIENKKYYSEEVKEIIIEKKKTKSEFEIQLTKRETEILQILPQGLTSIAISDKLCISKDTVDTHRKNLLSKFGVKNVAELIIKAKELGFLD